MQRQELSFGNFLFDVPPQHQPFVQKLHDELLARGYRLKLEMAKSGYLVSFSHPGTRRSLLNFVFRKRGLMMRLYADHLPGYAQLLDSLPDGMARLVEKSPVCKRLIDPADCNSRCPMGYEFELRGVHHKKCRYGCFLLPVTDESAPFLDALAAGEISARARESAE